MNRRNFRQLVEEADELEKDKCVLAEKLEAAYQEIRELKKELLRNKANELRKYAKANLRLGGSTMVINAQLLAAEILEERIEKNDF